MALDLGKKRIGLAVSDPLGITTRGLPTLHRTNVRADLAALGKLVEQEEAALVLVGYPLHLSGDESPQAAYTRNFAERLGKLTGVEIRYWDERLTSVEAETVLKESGRRPDRKSGAVDQMAARILLESYLHAEAGA